MSKTKAKYRALKMPVRYLINTVLVEGAYSALMDGHKDVHDAKIAQAVSEYLDSSDVIVLAQASMASAVQADGATADKVLTSPALGIEKLARDLESAAG